MSEPRARGGAGPRRHGAADHPEEAPREGARAAAARAGIGQRREDDAAEAAERGGRGGHLPHPGLQHQNPGAPRVPAARVGRGRAALPPLLLAQLLREHGRAALAPGRGRPAGVRQQAGPAGGAAGRRHPGAHPRPRAGRAAVAGAALRGGRGQAEGPGGGRPRDAAARPAALAAGLGPQPRPARGAQADPAGRGRGPAPPPGAAGGCGRRGRAGGGRGGRPEEVTQKTQKNPKTPKIPNKELPPQPRLPGVFGERLGPSSSASSPSSSSP
ncbi:hypothetical protein RLOC_00014833 [Lonchura striata]|uniref:Uncharacterized protein n=1 Tax=Lonchura striata TaxID=40157 RepID=A0A218U978_9PASE|nr:hypothetical protein RLOC_00014833 [Lonchura striata domestica]